MARGAQTPRARGPAGGHPSGPQGRHARACGPRWPGVVQPAGSLGSVHDARPLPRRAPRRPRRGPARPPGRRPLPLAGGRLVGRDQGVGGGPGRACSRRSAPAGRARTTGCAPHRPAVRRHRLGAGLARRAAVLHAPRPPEQEHAVLLTVDAGGTERVLVDPMALDPSGLTTLDTWQPTKEGAPARLPARRGRHRGVGAARAGRRHRRARRRPHRPGPLLARRLAARRRGVLLRPPAAPRARARRRGAVPPAGVAAPARHRPDRGRRWSSARAQAATEYYGVSVSRDGRWLQVSASEGTAPRNDLWLADLDGADRRGARRSRPVQVDVDAQTGLEVGRDGRASCSPTATRRAAGSASPTRTTPAAEHWVDLLAEDPERRARRLRGPRRTRARARRCCSRPGPGTPSPS